MEYIPHPTLQVGLHPNTLALYLDLVVPLAVALLIWPPPQGPQRAALAAPRWIRPLAIVLVVVAVPLLLLAQSRGAWLALAGTMALLGLGRRRMALVPFGAALLAAGMMVLAAGPTALAAALRAVAGGGQVSWRGRLWADAVELVGQQPLTGVGLNNFPFVYSRRPEYEGGFVFQGISQAHNTLLQAALDYGLPGFVAVVGIYGALGWTAWRVRRRLAGTPLEAAVVGLTFGLLAHALHGSVDAASIGAKPGFLAWAVAGALVGARVHGPRWSGRAMRAGRRERSPRVSRSRQLHAGAPRPESILDSAVDVKP
jgi:O-antigen ligase